MIRINDTIVAPSTNIATQAIALIRMSGEDAFSIINRIIHQPLPHKKGIFLRRLYQDQQLIDEVVINAYVEPKSFTGENVVEVACHGGILNTKRILQLLLSNGARLAMKGEFSQRAFINGKINLVEAEGINDLIHASNELALKIGVDNMSGKNNYAIIQLKKTLMQIISQIQVSIDYPDYDDVEGSTPEELLKLLQDILQQINRLLARSKMAAKSVTGIKTAIVGKTNVGKSSLLNLLLNEEKAIVTDIEGTTRDIIEGQIALNGVNLNLIDTAGIRETQDVVEKIGIKKTQEYLQQSELVLFVVDPQQIDDSENQKIFKWLQNRTYILVINKLDQISEITQTVWRKKYPDAVFTSATNQQIDELISKIQAKYNNDELLESNELILINAKQISLIEQIQKKIEQAYQNLSNYFPVDVVNVDLYGAWGLLNELIGEEYDDQIIDNIFRKYCLGK